MFEGFLKRGRLMVLLFFVIFLVGSYLFYQLPKREIPEFTANIVTVSTVYPGAEAAVVESDITDVLENALDQTKGIENINSVSTQEFSNIIIEINDGADFRRTADEVKQKISDAASSLPEEAFDPVVEDELGGAPVASYMFTADSFDTLLDYQENMEKLKQKIENLNGVSTVTIKGYSEKQAVLKLDSESLADNGLNAGAVIEAVNNEYKTTPLGETAQDGTNVRLSLNNFTDISEVTNLTLLSPVTNNTVEIGDLGEFAIEEKKQEDIVTYNGKPAYSFTVHIESGLDIPSIFEDVDSSLKENLSLPDGIELQDYYSQKADVDLIFDDLIREALIAVIAVIIITTLGLTLSGAFIVSLAIPFSITLGSIPLPWLGVDLNQISIIGLIIALGILVDDAIVVNDNILRQYKLQRNGNALQATRDGVKEVWGSIVTSTLAVVFAFSPLVLLSGANGSFIRSLPSVLILTIVASMIISLTLVPVYQYSVNRKKIRISDKEPGFLGKPLKKLGDYYADTLLAKIVKRPLLIGIGGIVLTTLIFFQAFFVPFEFFPAANKKEITVSVTLPTGYSLEETHAALEEIESDLLNFPETEETAVFTGTGVPRLFSETIDNPGENTGQIVARIDTGAVSSERFIENHTNDIREKHPDADIFLNTIIQGPPAGAPVTVKLSGNDFTKLNSLKNELTQQISSVDTGVITDDVGDPVSSIQYNLDRTQLTENNVTSKLVSDAIRLAANGVPLGTFKENGENIDFLIKQDEDIHENGIQLSSIEVPVQGEGPVPETISMNELVNEETVAQYQTIPRENGTRTITVRAYPGESDTFKDDVENIVNSMRDSVNEGYTLTLGGENEDQTQFFVEISLLFLVVMVLIYITIAFQFNSLLLPLLVLGTVYLAVAGAVAGLFVTQTPFSFMATMGIVSLAGIVVRNSVVLFEFIEQRMRAGLSRAEAVIEAGRARIRPILLTAFTAIAALLPVAASDDPLFKPLAICIVSGVLFSTILTLLIVPALYILVDKLRTRKEA
ncbi:MMPL family transporter [Bacillus lacus]|uniref:MMPL family transporter n=1 Tax=Metabacillus lacus TaxID=1983721 RepID=A0A7X2IX26_9BACI|nr:efflux RND transporter permease subunit [Metabacillus lacus]MRX71199.1 MMPL family transporter [Metabacillus lacus]